MSGPAKTLDELERDVGVTRVVAFGWSSARLLDYPLSPFAAISGV